MKRRQICYVRTGARSAKIFIVFRLEIYGKRFFCRFQLLEAQCYHKNLIDTRYFTAGNVDLPVENAFRPQTKRDPQTFLVLWLKNQSYCKEVLKWELLCLFWIYLVRFFSCGLEGVKGYASANSSIVLSAMKCIVRTDLEPFADCSLALCWCFRRDR